MSRINGQWNRHYSARKRRRVRQASGWKSCNANSRYQLTLPQTPKRDEKRSRKHSPQKMAVELEVDAFGPDPTGWFHLPQLELPLVSKVCTWCIHSLFEGFEKAKDLVFPSRVIKRDLQTTLTRLEDLENELKKLKKEKENYKHPSCQRCCLHRDSKKSFDGDDNLPAHKSRCNTDVAVNTSFIFGSNPPVSLGELQPPKANVPSPPPVAVPPPPPPPPPPGSLFKPVDLGFLKKKKSEKTKVLAEKSSNPVITLQDLKKVKLKPVQDVRDDTKQVTPPPRNQPVVLLNDLQKVQLKRSRSESDKPDPDINSNRTSELEKLWKGIPKEVQAFQNRLKKVDIARSPGGTPIRPTDLEEHGTGLTPLMTKALKRKFRRARTPSSSPISL